MNNKHLILFVILFALSNCKKDNTTTPSVFTEASYPLAIGNWWQYVLRSAGNSPDTIMLSVVSITNVGPYVQYKCYFSYDGSITDSAYFVQSDTSLSFVNTSPYADFSAIQNFHIKFPAMKGSYWQGAFPGDSTLVVGVSDSYSSYGHTYGPCYHTNESYNLPHNFKAESMILTPKIGVIYQSIDFNSDTAEGGAQVQQSLNLINYHVQ